MKKKIFLSLLASGILVAQDVELKQIEITASQGVTQNQKDVTDSVIVITKEMIDELRVTNLAQALNRAGNIATSQNGGVGQPSSMFIRGMDSKRTLVLIDGVRYNNPTAVGSVAEFEQIMLYNVSRIEVIKGAQSGVWGADASGGVINIVTSKVEDALHGGVDLSYGSFNTKKSSFVASYGAEKFDIALGGLLYYTDGFSAVEPKQNEVGYGSRYDDLDLERDAYKNRSLNAKIGLNISDKDRVEASVKSIEGSIDFDSWSGVSGDSSLPNTELKNRFYALAYKHDEKDHELSLNYNLSTFDRDIKGDGWSAKYKGSVDEVKIEDKFDYMSDSFLRFGSSYQKFEQEDLLAQSDKSYDVRSLFIANYNKFELFEKRSTILSESVRFDDYDSIKNSTSFKIGLKQFVYSDFYIALNSATGFNAPTLDELYGPWGSNPDLKPEKSFTNDITLGNEKVYVTAFYNEIRDLIEYDMSSWGYVQTFGKSKFRGYELGYRDYLSDLVDFESMYTYLDAKNANSQDLARRPKHQIDTKVTYHPISPVDLSLNAQYIGERYDAINRSGVQSGKYVTANFVTNIRANRYLSFYGKVDNIADKYYQVVDGYATAGRSFYVGLNAKY